MFRSLRARLILTFGGLTLLAVVVFALVVAGAVERLVLARLAQDLVAQSRLVVSIVGRDLAARDLLAVQRDLTVVNAATPALALVVDERGILVGASQRTLREELGSVEARSGFLAALGGQEVSGVLPRLGPESDILYVAIPVIADGRTIGAVRLSYQLEDVEQTLTDLNTRILGGAVVIALIAALVAAWIAGAIATPVRALSRAAESLARGDLEQRVITRQTDEVGVLVQSFNAMADRLRELETARREFAADVAHELHSLASAMQTAATALAQGADREPALRDRLVAGLVGHTGRLGRLADDLLELAQLEANPLTVNVEPTSLGEVARQSVAEWTAEAAQRGRQLELSVDGDATVLGDRDRLVQACGNLVENAIKYAPDGGRVVVRVSAGHHHHHLEIADNGAGIPADELPLIFHRFYRVEGRAGAGPAGMGLGLAIVDRIVRAHGGTISVTSTVGEGTAFHVQLPVYEPQPVAAGIAVPSAAASTTGSGAAPD